MAVEEAKVVYRLRNRTLILVASPIVVAYSAVRIVENLMCGDPWLNWLGGLLVWLVLCFLGLRRRLVLARDWIEYVESFGAIRVPWAQVIGVSSRRVLGIWRIEGLVCWSAQPRLERRFIDLMQFDPAWQQHDLGRLLRARAPKAFERSAA